MRGRIKSYGLMHSASYGTDWKIVRNMYFGSDGSIEKVVVAPVAYSSQSESDDAILSIEREVGQFHDLPKERG